MSEIVRGPGETALNLESTQFIILKYPKNYSTNNSACTGNLHQKWPRETCQNLHKISEFLGFLKAAMSEILRKLAKPLKN